MRQRLVMILVAAALGCVSGSACAMNSTENPSSGCRVVNGDKLPAASGGADALCREIAAATAAAAPGVVIRSRSRCFRDRACRRS